MGAYGVSALPSWKSAEVSRFHPFSPVFGRSRAALGKSRTRRQTLVICLNTHFSNPHLRHSNSVAFTGCLRFVFALLGWNSMHWGCESCESNEDLHMSSLKPSLASEWELSKVNWQVVSNQVGMFWASCAMWFELSWQRFRATSWLEQEGPTLQPLWAMAVTWNNQAWIGDKTCEM